MEEIVTSVAVILPPYVACNPLAEEPPVEVIVVPDDDSIELDYMEAMVYEINRTQVNQEDRLSDHVYRYSSDEGLKRAA